MFFVETTYTITFEEKKSKFISFLTPYSNFEPLLQQLKLEHPKARHIIWAYRYINSENQIVENSTDDAEPKGGAGKPTLSVLRGAELVNTALLTVRYFGGIKLGVGGMVRAYSTSANLVVADSKLLPYINFHEQKVIIGYKQLSKFEYFCEKNGLIIVDKTFDENVTLSIKGTQEGLNLMSELDYSIS